MRVWVWLFHAKVEDAPAIRSIVTINARRFDEWPHLIVPEIDGPDVNVLEKLARPKRPKWSSRIGGVLLDRSKLTDEPFTAVSQWSPEFITAITSLDDPGVEKLATAWSGSIDEVSQQDAIRLVRQIKEFVQRAVESGISVLELVRM